MAGRTVFRSTRQDPASVARTASPLGRPRRARPRPRFVDTHATAGPALACDARDGVDNNAIPRRPAWRRRLTGREKPVRLRRELHEREE